MLIRKGNEGIFRNHPIIDEVLVWDKKNSKYKNLLGIIKKVRKKRFDLVLNLQRFFATGLITALSGANEKIGFDKNPLSVFYTKKIEHTIGDGRHEVNRNLELVKHLSGVEFQRPVLYPDNSDFDKVHDYKEIEYYCLAPTSVWFTKQWPEFKWLDLISKLPNDARIYLLGAPNDREACEEILQKSNNEMVVNLCGQLDLLQSAALMKDARMNFVNDSAPMHLASSMNAPTTAIFCSTIPDFGFGPLSDNAAIWETKKDLDCRPCGLHGRSSCPEGHFNCAKSIEVTL